MPHTINNKLKYLNHMYTHMPCTHHNHTSSIPQTSIAVTLAPTHSTAYTHTTQTTVHVLQSHQPLHPHGVPRQHHIHTKYDHITTYTTQGNRPSSKSLIMLPVNINGIKNKLEERKLLIHDIHADIITIRKI